MCINHHHVYAFFGFLFPSLFLFCLFDCAFTARETVPLLFVYSRNQRSRKKEKLRGGQRRLHKIVKSCRSSRKRGRLQDRNFVVATATLLVVNESVDASITGVFVASLPSPADRAAVMASAETRWRCQLQCPPSPTFFFSFQINQVEEEGNIFASNQHHKYWENFVCQVEDCNQQSFSISLRRIAWLVLSLSPNLAPQVKVCMCVRKCVHRVHLNANRPYD